MTIGERIRARRLDLGLTQQELAEKTGYSDKTAINKIELNLRSLPQSKIKIMAFALETTPDYLLDWDDVPITSIGSAASKQRILSQDESDFLDDYQKLNAYGRQKAREYISDLTGNKKYTEDTGSSASTAG